MHRRVAPVVLSLRLLGARARSLTDDDDDDDEDHRRGSNTFHGTLTEPTAETLQTGRTKEKKKRK